MEAHELAPLPPEWYLYTTSADEETAIDALVAQGVPMIETLDKPQRLCYNRERE